MKELINEILKETSNITDKNDLHSYVDEFYSKEFLKYKNSPITLIEIGVHYGGSLRLWEKYFSNSILYGIDVIERDSEFKQFIANKKNINYIIGDAYTETIKNILPNYDIFIDDGPHTLTSQISSLELYVPKMNINGIFIIEDVQNIQHIEIFNNIIEEKFKAFTCRCVDLRNIKNRYDDILFVVERK